MAGEKPAMLQFSGLIYLLGERLLIDNAAAALPSGRRRAGVGVVNLVLLFDRDIGEVKDARLHLFVGGLHLK